MSWKAIELQIAMPRTLDAGKLQEQFNKQPQHLQHSLGMKQQKKNRLKMKQTNPMNSSEFNTIKNNDNRERRKGNNQQENKKSHKEEEQELSLHPYLGKKIDFRG